MKSTKKYFAPDLELVSFEIENDITVDIVSSIEDTTHDAIIDWT
jgi:hypothetical protein